MPTSAQQFAPFFTKICGAYDTSQRADVGIGPYRCVRDLRVSASNERRKEELP